MVRFINNKKILCSVGEYYISYRAGNLFIQKGVLGNECFFLPLPSTKRMLLKSRTLERFFRLEPRIAVPINDTTFLLSYQGTIYLVDIKKKTIKKEHHFREGMNNPLSFCELDGQIFYGEYFRNQSYNPVAIYRRDSKGRWEKVFQFASHEVIHIHQIVFDKYRDCFYVLSGDEDKESAIWKASKDFDKVEPIFRGKQKYRSCFMFVEKNNLTYVTDTPLEENAVYSIRVDGNHYEEPVWVCSIPGPCIYGREWRGDECIIATSVEPDATLPNYRYRLTSTLGKGVRDKYVHILKGNCSDGLHEIVSFKKDIFPMWAFQFGNVQFANCPELVLTGQSIEKYDGKSLLLNVSEQK